MKKIIFAILIFTLANTSFAGKFKKKIRNIAPVAVLGAVPLQAVVGVVAANHGVQRAAEPIVAPVIAQNRHGLVDPIVDAIQPNIERAMMKITLSINGYFEKVFTSINIAAEFINERFSAIESNTDYINTSLVQNLCFARVFDAYTEALSKFIDEELKIHTQIVEEKEKLANSENQKLVINRKAVETHMANLLNLLNRRNEIKERAINYGIRYLNLMNGQSTNTSTNTRADTQSQVMSMYYNSLEYNGITLRAIYENVKEAYTRVDYSDFNDLYERQLNSCVSDEVFVDLDDL